MDTIKTHTKTEEIVPGHVYVSSFNDGFRVASVQYPHFCVARATRDEALDAALDLLKTFLEWKTGTAINLTAGESKPFAPPKVTFQHFAPSEVVTLERAKVAA